MQNSEILKKRIRRCEVANLETAEDIAEMMLMVRALYEALIVLSRRTGGAVNSGDDPLNVLMLPQWYSDTATGNVLPPPLGLDVEAKGLAAFRLKLDWLDDEQRSELFHRQQRHLKRRETLRERETERKRQVEKGYREGGPSL